MLKEISLNFQMRPLILFQLLIVMTYNIDSELCRNYRTNVTIYIIFNSIGTYALTLYAQELLCPLNL